MFPGLCDCGTALADHYVILFEAALAGVTDAATVSDAPYLFSWHCFARLPEFALLQLETLLRIIIVACLRHEAYLHLGATASQQQLQSSSIVVTMGSRSYMYTMNFSQHSSFTGLTFVRPADKQSSFCPVTDLVPSRCWAPAIFSCSLRNQAGSCARVACLIHMRMLSRLVGSCPQDKKHMMSNFPKNDRSCCVGSGLVL